MAYDIDGGGWWVAGDRIIRGRTISWMILPTMILSRRGDECRLSRRLRPARVRAGRARRLPAAALGEDRVLAETRVRRRVTNASQDVTDCGARIFVFIILLGHLQLVQRTARGCAKATRHMQVNHRGFDIRVPEQLLDFADIHAVDQKVCRETVAQRV